MEELLAALTSPVWWISVLVAGVVANLLAYYLRGAWVRVTSKVSRRSQRKAEDRSRRRRARIAEFKENRQLQMIGAVDASDDRQSGFFFITFGVLIIMLGTLLEFASHPAGGAEVWMVRSTFLISQIAGLGAVLGGMYRFREGTGIWRDLAASGALDYRKVDETSQDESESPSVDSAGTDSDAPIQ